MTITLKLKVRRLEAKLKNLKMEKRELSYMVDKLNKEILDNEKTIDYLHTVIEDQHKEIINWSNGETLNRNGILNELNKKEEQLSNIYCWIDDKIDELEDKYDFGKKNGFCEMHNIRFAINVLKELQNEIKGDVE